MAKLIYSMLTSLAAHDISVDGPELAAQAIAAGWWMSFSRSCAQFSSAAESDSSRTAWGST
jgi:hypothetical protein